MNDEQWPEWILSITLTKPGGGGETFQRKFRRPFAPVPGVEIEDPAWKEAQIPLAIIPGQSLLRRLSARCS